MITRVEVNLEKYKNSSGTRGLVDEKGNYFEDSLLFIIVQISLTSSYPVEWVCLVARKLCWIIFFPEVFIKEDKLKRNLLAQSVQSKIFLQTRL